MPIFIHNLGPYDAHPLILELGDSPGLLKVIPTSEENYISIMKQHGKLQFRFVDSYRFLPAPLNKLISLLPPEKFYHTKRHFPQDVFDLLMRKGVYPYDYFDGWDKYEETQLPSKEQFYNSLNGEDISSEDYKHACDVWNRLKCKTLADFTLYYVKLDTLQLCDVFQSTREIFHTTYGLDPAWCLTLPAYSLQTMLYQTRINIELLTDINMQYLVLEGIRGGYACINKKFSAARNKYVGFPPKKGCKVKHLIFWDANNLYGKSLTYPLPLDGFRYLTENELVNFDVMKTTDNDLKGYLLQVDLEYNRNLHDEHSCFPFCFENRVPPNGKTNKLIGTLYDKDHYVIHIKALRQAMEFGLTLKKIHRAIEFNQAPFIREYVLMNTKLRKHAKSDFESGIYKYINCSIFGKTLEAAHKRKNIEVVSNRSRFQKLVSDPFFESATIFDKNLAAIHKFKKIVKYDRPNIIGQAVLDISKSIIYDFVYRVLKPLYGNSIKILATDTDSICAEITNHDIYEDMFYLDKHFDTSDYPKDHTLFSTKNTKVLGLMKDEFNSTPIQLFAGCRTKAYAIQTPISEKKKLKGIKRKLVKDGISVDNYLECIFQRKDFFHKQKTIVSKKHKLYTVETTKKSLSCEDDKRFQLIDGISSLPYGHYSITTHQTHLKRLHEELVMKRKRVPSFDEHNLIKIPRTD